MVYRGPTGASWELVPRIKPKENPRQPPLHAHTHTESFPWGCGPPFFLEVSFSSISPVFFFCKPLYYLCAHAWRLEENSEEWFSLSPLWDLGIGLGSSGLQFSLLSHHMSPISLLFFIFIFTSLTSADIFILNF